MTRPASSLTVALLHETFHDAGGADRLRARLAEARRQGAELAVLPELPLQYWMGAGRVARDEDAEPQEGPRQRQMAAAASESRIGLLGGAIVREAGSGRRFNRALLFDAAGRLVQAYDKLHLPSEEGFYESDHYEAGTQPPRRVDDFGLPLGIQLCSDINRPEGSHVLGAQGAAVILAPRATPGQSYGRWLLVLRANALTSCAYVVSVNRPGPEPGVELGGPSVVVGPDGAVLLETTEPLSVVRLEGSAVARAREDYPGYLDVRSGLYARAWSALAERPAVRSAGEEFRPHLLGIDDGSFDKRRDSLVPVVGVMMEGHGLVESVALTRFGVDGAGAAEFLAGWIEGLRLAPALHGVLLAGITIAGLGVVDIELLSAGLSLPVLVVNRRDPRNDQLIQALAAAGLAERAAIVERTPAAWPLEQGLFVAQAGATVEQARRLLLGSRAKSRFPEPLRLAHLIGAALTSGESHGRP